MRDKMGKIRANWYQWKIEEIRTGRLSYALGVSCQNPWNRIRNPALYPIELQAQSRNKFNESFLHSVVLIVP